MRADLAAVIVDARRAADLSQAQLARRSCISASYLSRIEGAAWERGGPWPSDAVLRALARALGISSTELVARRDEARGRQRRQAAPGQPARAGSRTPYSVVIGPEAADAAARAVVSRNPPGGKLRSAQVLTGAASAGPSYLDHLGAAMADRPEAMLYRVCASDRRNLGTARGTVDTLAGGRPAEEAGNVRTRYALANPLVLDVLIGENEAFLAVPDRRGHPYLRAGIVVDDPDLVAALRDWFDESVWDSPSGHADVRGEEIGAALAATEQSLAGDRRDRNLSAATG